MRARETPAPLPDLIVYCLHDSGSVEFAATVHAKLSGSVVAVVEEPVDDGRWTGLRVVVADTGRLVTSHRWQRGQERNLDQEAYQIVKGIRLLSLDRIYTPQERGDLRKELGIEPTKGRPLRGIGARRKRAEARDK